MQRIKKQQQQQTKLLIKISSNQRRDDKESFDISSRYLFFITYMILQTVLLIIKETVVNVQTIAVVAHHYTPITGQIRLKKSSEVNRIIGIGK